MVITNSQLVVPNAFDLIKSRTEALGQASNINSTETSKVQQRFADERKILLECGNNVLPLVTTVLDGLFKRGEDPRNNFTAGQIELTNGTYFIQSVKFNGDIKQQDYENEAWKENAQNLSFSLLNSLGGNHMGLSIATNGPVAAINADSINQLQLSHVTNEEPGMVDIHYHRSPLTRHSALRQHPEHFNSNEELISMRSVKDGVDSTSYLSARSYLAKQGR